MSALTVSLSDDAREFVEAEATAGGFESPDSYIQGLIRAEQKRKAREKLEALIIEGLESGEPTPMTAEDWDSLRQGLELTRPS
jgi:antitoxin ParD1/3/4